MVAIQKVPLRCRYCGAGGIGRREIERIKEASDYARDMGIHADIRERERERERARGNWPSKQKLAIQADLNASRHLAARLIALPKAVDANGLRSSGSSVWMRRRLPRVTVVQRTGNTKKYQYTVQSKTLYSTQHIGYRTQTQNTRRTSTQSTVRSTR